MSRRTRIALVLLPLVAGLLYVALNWWVLEDKPIWVQAGPQARANPFLAFERLLDRMGARREDLVTVSDLSRLPAGATLFLGAHRLAYMTPRTVSAVVDWVDGGGHLVVEAEHFETRDPLLDALGIQRRGPKPDTRQRTQAEVLKELMAQREAAPVTVSWPGAATTLRVDLPTLTRLIVAPGREPLASIMANQRTIAVRVASGKGDVTVMPSLDFLDNTKVGQLDHAEFGWLLASHGEAAPHVLVFLRFQSQPLGEWIWREAWMVVIAFALFLVLWLGRVIPRFGPLAPDVQLQRRSLAEHIVASGRFLWSRGERRYLVAAVRERALRFARSRGLAGSEVPAVGGNVDTAPAFIAAISRLAAIETRLARRGAALKPAEDKKP